MLQGGGGRRLGRGVSNIVKPKGSGFRIQGFPKPFTFRCTRARSVVADRTAEIILKI